MPSDKNDSSIILLERFIQATRDAGYKGTASAISELVDNSIQAQATAISIDITTNKSKELCVAVMDNGTGMDRRTLRQSLRFGGSSRFDDRSSLGRYGMGLPNASLSQARRVEVYSWKTSARPWFVRLDLDEIAAGRSAHVPEPRRAPWPSVASKPESAQGTLVLWRKCDRLDYRRAGTISRKLIPVLGRVFRYYIWEGVAILVNGQTVRAVDPLLLDKRATRSGARRFGKSVSYEINTSLEKGSSKTGTVHVTFSELPVHDWCDLSNQEKAEMGVTKGAGVSVVRAGREIDYGWFFMGSKRRENYDDWWRCEVRFEPVLDEVFGLTFTKQQVHPRSDLLRAIASDIEATGRALNARVRQSHIDAKSRQSIRVTEAIAVELDRHLPRLPQRATRGAKAAMNVIVARHPEVQAQLRGRRSDGMKYAIVHEELEDGSFYAFDTDGQRFVLRINTEHPFFRKVYKPLLEGAADQQTARALELLLLSAARQQASSRGTNIAEAVQKGLLEWSKILALYLNG